jgi:RNA polymerase sigma factor (sigma-70 family)
MLNIADLDVAAALPDDMILLVDEALEQFKLEDPEKARVVILKFFGGLTDREVAEIIGMTERTVRRQWTYAKAWLYENISGKL